MEIIVRRDIGALNEIFDFVDSGSSRLNLDTGVQFAIRLALEELFTNIIKYSPSTTNSDIGISLERKANRLILQVTDYGVAAFDIRNVKDADTNKPLDERKAGGLGLHLVKRMVDTIDYEYADGKSKIIMTKYLE
jgi:anti-sigma regulatory factor (Ser/Thr protein kinase)